MHPLTVDIGMPWTAQFFTGKEGWQAPQNLVRSIDQFLAATIAYGHIGWLVEEGHGMRQTCRSYYMLQPLQSRYAMLKPDAIRYGSQNGNLLESSDAFRSGEWRDSRLFVQYPNGLRIWVNGNDSQSWSVRDGADVYDLPPYGWLALGADGFFDASVNLEGNRVDRVSAPELVFLDGRGQSVIVDGIGSAGSVAVRKSRNGPGLSVTTVEAVDRLTLTDVGREFDALGVQAVIQKVVQASAITVHAFDELGQELQPVSARRVDAGWEIQPPASSVRLEIVAQ
jgi:hypothetical protein